MAQQQLLIFPCNGNGREGQAGEQLREHAVGLSGIDAARIIPAALNPPQCRKAGCRKPWPVCGVPSPGVKTGSEYLFRITRDRLPHVIASLC